MTLPAEGLNGAACSRISGCQFLEGIRPMAAKEVLSSRASGAGNTHACCPRARYEPRFGSIPVGMGAPQISDAGSETRSIESGLQSLVVYPDG
jgi:hypothetical protein